LCENNENIDLHSDINWITKLFSHYFRDKSWRQNKLEKNYEKKQTYFDVLDETKFLSLIF